MSLGIWGSWFPLRVEVCAYSISMACRGVVRLLMTHSSDNEKKKKKKQKSKSKRQTEEKELSLYCIAIEAKN